MPSWSAATLFASCTTLTGGSFSDILGTVPVGTGGTFSPNPVPRSSFEPLGKCFSSPGIGESTLTFCMGEAEGSGRRGKLTSRNSVRE